MGQTLTEKILSAHLVEGEMVKGSEIGIRIDQTLTQDARSEERRVGKECRSRWSPYH